MSMRWDHGVSWHSELIVPPSNEPIDLEFVRDDHLRVVNDDLEDDYIESLIRTARRAAERHTRRALMTQDWALVLDRFPCVEIELPRPPLQEVLSIEYTDADGNPQTWATSGYQVSAGFGPTAQKARIRPAYGTTWPTARWQMDAVTVTYRAGYVTQGSPATPDVPDDIIHGMLLVIGELYKQRSESVASVLNQPSIVRAYDLWAGYRAH